MITFNNGDPPCDGWYLVEADHFDSPRLRAYGNGMWWTDLGRGDGLDGWLGHHSDPGYRWAGPVCDVMNPKPTIDDAYAALAAKEPRE